MGGWLQDPATLPLGKRPCTWQAHDWVRPKASLITWRIKPQIVHCMMEYTDLTKASFTFKIPYGFPVQGEPKRNPLLPKEKYCHPEPVFTTFKTVQLHYMHISYTELKQSWIIKVELTSRNCFMPLQKYGFHCVNFHKTQNHPNKCSGHLLFWILAKSNETRKLSNISCMPLSTVWLSLHPFW
jgi:hypothetical protein